MRARLSMDRIIDVYYEFAPLGPLLNPYAAVSRNGSEGIAFSPRQFIMLILYIINQCTYMLCYLYTSPNCLRCHHISTYLPTYLISLLEWTFVLFYSFLKMPPFGPLLFLPQRTPCPMGNGKKKFFLIASLLC